MYDASQGSKAGAHIEATTRSGTNQFHGVVYDYFQNNIFNAAPFFRNASTAISQHDKVPALHYNRFGGTLGGPIVKNKLFFFGAYQDIRDHDALNGTKTAHHAAAPYRRPQRAGPCEYARRQTSARHLSPSQVNPAALQLFQAKVGGNYLIPTPQITNPAASQAARLRRLSAGPLHLRRAIRPWWIWTT